MDKERVWTEAEIREALKRVESQHIWHNDQLFDELKKPNPDPMDNPVFKKIAERLKKSALWVGDDQLNDHLSRESLAEACADIVELPEELSEADHKWLENGKVPFNDDSTWLDEIDRATVNAWLKWRHNR